MAEDQLADVRRQAVLQRLGGKDPSHVVGSERERAAGAGREGPAHPRGVLDAPFYVVAAEWPVLRAGAALQQQRRRRVPHALERIVGRDQGDGPGALAADPRDDDGQDLAEFGRDNQHALDVGFRRRDVQERDQLRYRAADSGRDCDGTARPVPRSGSRSDAEQLNAGPCPEPALFLFGQVPPFPGAARSSAQILGLGFSCYVRASVSPFRRLTPGRARRPLPPPAGTRPR